MSKLLLLGLFSTLLQGFLFLDRNEVITEYQPVLLKKQELIESECRLASREKQLLLLQQANTTTAASSLMSFQIKKLLANIAAAQDGSRNKTCLENLKKAAQNLDANSINSTCLGLNSNFESLLGYCGVLAKLPTLSISLCNSLNPLGSEDEAFLECVGGKVLDLDEQIGIFERNLTEVRKETIQSNIRCVGEESAKIAEKISDITLEMALC